MFRCYNGKSKGYFGGISYDYRAKCKELLCF